MQSLFLSASPFWKIIIWSKWHIYFHVQTFHWYYCHRSGHWLNLWKGLPRTCHSDFGTALSYPHAWLGRSECDSAQRSHIGCGSPADWSWFLCLHGTALRWCLSARLAPMNSILNMYLLTTIAPMYLIAANVILSQFSCSPFPVYLSSALTSSSLRNLLPLLNIRFPLATNNPDKAAVFSKWVVFLIVTVSVSVYQPPYLILFWILLWTFNFHPYVTCEEQPIWICHCSELFCNTKIGFFHPRTSLQVESLV